QAYTTKISTTTTVSSSQNPSTYGQSVSFTATATPASGSTAPTGSVQFKIDGVTFGSPKPLSGGAATSDATTTLTAAGSPHTIQAVYSPDTASFSGSTGSVSGGQTVSKAASTVTVTCTAGAPYTYTGSARTPCTAEATGVGMSPVDVN